MGFGGLENLETGAKPFAAGTSSLGLGLVFLLRDARRKTWVSASRPPRAAMVLTSSPPANAFAGPMAVVDDQDLTLTEKRALLASWATDARATGAAPHPARRRVGRAQ